MSRMIFWVSFLLIISSVFLVGSILYRQSSPRDLVGSATPEPKSEIFPLTPRAISAQTAETINFVSPVPETPISETIPVPQSAVAESAQEKAISASPVPQTSISQGAVSNTDKLPAVEQNKNEGITETKTEPSQLEKDEPNNSEEQSQTPNLKGEVGSETLLVLDGKVFRPGQVELTQGALEAVGKIVPLIKERSGLAVLVEGHSDSYSSASDSATAAEENRQISVSRAKEVARIFEQQGITADRIVVRGYGDTHPVKSNASQQGRSRNRRVEIKLVPLLDRE